MNQMKECPNLEGRVITLVAPTATVTSAVSSNINTQPSVKLTNLRPNTVSEMPPTNPGTAAVFPTIPFGSALEQERISGLRSADINKANCLPGKRPPRKRRPPKVKVNSDGAVQITFRHLVPPKCEASQSPRTQTVTTAQTQNSTPIPCRPRLVPLLPKPSSANFVGQGSGLNQNRIVISNYSPNSFIRYPLQIVTRQESTNGSVTTPLLLTECSSVKLSDKANNHQTVTDSSTEKSTCQLQPYPVPHTSVQISKPASVSSVQTNSPTLVPSNDMQSHSLVSGTGAKTHCMLTANQIENCSPGSKIHTLIESNLHNNMANIHQNGIKTSEPPNGLLKTLALINRQSETSCTSEGTSQNSTQTFTCDDRPSSPMCLEEDLSNLLSDFYGDFPGFSPSQLYLNGTEAYQNATDAAVTSQFPADQEENSRALSWPEETSGKCCCDSEAVTAGTEPSGCQTANDSAESVVPLGIASFTGQVPMCSAQNNISIGTGSLAGSAQDPSAKCTQTPVSQMEAGSAQIHVPSQVEAGSAQSCVITHTESSVSQLQAGSTQGCSPSPPVSLDSANQENVEGTGRYYNALRTHQYSIVEELGVARFESARSTTSGDRDEEMQMEVDAHPYESLPRNSQDFSKSERLVDLIDVSPEFGSGEGGGKIILIGSWNNRDARYEGCFGELKVPAELIQNGVLRCYCPPHKPGKVLVKVLKDGTPISNSVEFEYVDTQDVNEVKETKDHTWLNIGEDDIKKLLVERIEAIRIILSPGHANNTEENIFSRLCSPDLEEQLISICELLLSSKDATPDISYRIEGSMTALHLAAALGYTKLIQVLCCWIETNWNVVISQEADPLKEDQFSLTPLIWACAKGKFDTMCVLLQWNEASVEKADRCGCTPLSIANEQGFSMLGKYLEKFQSRSHCRDRIQCSDSGSPRLSVSHMKGYVSRSSSLGSQPDPSPSSDDYLSSSWESRHSATGIDADVWTTARGGSRSFSESSTERPCSSAASISSRTLGKTLAHVQAIIQEGACNDAEDAASGSPLIDGDSEDESLFDGPPFTPPRNLTVSVDSQQAISTPKSSISSLSPAPSPCQGGGGQSPFNPKSQETAEFVEFFFNSKKILEKDFAELTLTDQEQQELYRAASIIQNAYKSYRERRKQRDVEFQSAVLIQSYYRRYKQYASFKKMQRGAVVIQNQFRAHREKERKKSHAASVIQSYYRRYRERKQTQEDQTTSVKERNRAKKQADLQANRFLQQTSNRLRNFPEGKNPESR